MTSEFVYHFILFDQKVILDFTAKEIQHPVEFVKAVAEGKINYL